MDGSDPRKPGAVAETGKTILAENDEKCFFIPSVMNGGDNHNATWRGA